MRRGNAKRSFTFVGCFFKAPRKLIKNFLCCSFCFSNIFGTYLLNPFFYFFGFLRLCRLTQSNQFSHVNSQHFCKPLSISNPLRRYHISSGESIPSKYKPRLRV